MTKFELILTFALMFLSSLIVLGDIPQIIYYHTRSKIHSSSDPISKSSRDAKHMLIVRTIAICILIAVLIYVARDAQSATSLRGR